MAFERRPRRANTTKAGLGYAHQRDRERLLAALVEGTPCPYWGVDPKCVGGMYRDQELDRDHSTPRALGGVQSPGRLAHRGCNRRAGARLGGRLSHAKGKAVRRAVQPPAPQARRSRAW